MRYINTKTGAIIDSLSKITGKAWKLVDEVEQEQDKVNDLIEEVEEYVEEEIDLEAMTKAQLIDFAKEEEIVVNEKDTKAVIIDTIAKAFE